MDHSEVCTPNVNGIAGPSLVPAATCAQDFRAKDGHPIVVASSWTSVQGGGGFEVLDLYSR
jgi:hypothetical protein